jgi:Domain of unknown function (DUF243)
VAPEDTKYYPKPKPQPPKAQKHYKIIFIKAPSFDNYFAEHQAAHKATTSQEKTLVYVLNQDPTGELPNPVPSETPTAPTKPEVFFIKYRPTESAVPESVAIDAPANLESENLYGGFGDITDFDDNFGEGGIDFGSKPSFTGSSGDGLTHERPLSYETNEMAEIVDPRGILAINVEDEMS